MPTYFADTWFFVALLSRRDSHHRQAARLQLGLSSAKVTTHDAVLTEVLNYFAKEGPSLRTTGVDTVRRVLHMYEVVPADRSLFLRALDRYAARPDKEYSLVDCMSMVVMEERGIRHVLTNDHHFAQAGFTVVSQ